MTGGEPFVRVVEPAFLPDPGGLLLLSVELLRLSWLSKSSAARYFSDPIALW
jgi:hypothetical protein